MADDSEHRHAVCLESAMAQLLSSALDLDLQEILGCDGDRNHCAMQV